MFYWDVKIQNKKRRTLGSNFFKDNKLEKADVLNANAQSTIRNFERPKFTKMNIIRCLCFTKMGIIRCLCLTKMGIVRFKCIKK